MEFDIARRTVDYLLSRRGSSAAIRHLGFHRRRTAAGNRTDRPHLRLRRRRRLYETDHPWFDAYRLFLSTNGLLFAGSKYSASSQNKTHASIGISVDGDRAQAQPAAYLSRRAGLLRQRCAECPRWLEQFPKAGTKATVGPNDLPLIKESVLHLWSLGIKEVNINCVFEDVWHEGDNGDPRGPVAPAADHILKHRLYLDHACSFFQDARGKLSRPGAGNAELVRPGKMLAVDGTGNFYPCVHFVGFSLPNANRALSAIASTASTSTSCVLIWPSTGEAKLQECMDCEINGGCAWCPAQTMISPTRTRSISAPAFICRMHKARVREPLLLGAVPSPAGPAAKNRPARRNGRVVA